jgi:two-component system NarL family response regulator
MLPIRLVIADDHALFRQGLVSLLRLQPGIEVVAEVEHADEIMPLLNTLICDIVLLDLQIGRSSMNDIPELSQRAAVIVLTANESSDAGMKALELGARGIVQKRFAVETLITAIRTVAEGLVWMPPTVQAAFASGANSSAKRLTARESEVLRYVALGLRNAEVAKRMSVSEATVKTHLTNIFNKLGFRDRLELTRYAVKIGVIDG